MSKVDDFRRLVFKNSGRIPSLLALAHEQLSFEEAQQTYAWVLKSPLIASIYQPQITPQTYTQLKYHDRKMPVLDTTGELERLAHIIIANATRIKTYLDVERRLTRALMCGDYDQVEVLTKSLATSVGVSFWTLDIEMMIAFNRGGIAAVRSFRRSVKQTNEDLIVDLFGYFAELKNQAEVSARGLNAELERILKIFEKSTNPLGDLISLLVSPRPLYREKALRHMLYFAWGLPLTDQYRTFLKLAPVAIQYDNVDKKRLTHCIVKIWESVNDIRLSRLRDFIEQDTQALVEHSDPVLAKMIDEYTVGHDEEFASRAVAELNERPATTAAIDLLSKLSPKLVAEKVNGWPVYSLLRRTILALNTLYHGESPLEQRLDDIHRMEWSNTATGLAEFVGSFASWQTQTNSLSYSLTVVETITAKTASKFARLDDRFAFLSALRKRVGGGPTIDLMAFAYTETLPAEPPATVPCYRQLFFTAVRMELARDFSGAADMLDRLVKRIESAENIDRRSLSEAYRSLFRTSQLSANTAHALEVAFRSHRRDPELFKTLGIDGLLQEIETKNPSEENKNIKSPIVAALWFRDGKKVHPFCQRFLAAHGCKIPMDLRPISAHFPTEDLVWFLHVGCRLNVLSNNFWLDGTDDLENQRIEICRWVSEISPELAANARAEIATIARNSVIRKGVQRIEQSRIHVHTEGIRNKLDRTIQESLLRIQSLWSLPPGEIEQLIDPAELYQRIIDAATKSESRTILLVNDPAFPVFENLFITVRDEFAGRTEFGLDSYLGVRIRHGTLLGQLRRSFTLQMLVSAKNEKGVYDENVHWKRRLGLPEWVWAHISSSLAELSRFVDEGTSRIRDQWIKVSTEVDPSEGLFDFVFSRKELLSIYGERISRHTTIDGFCSVIFDELWARTSICLDRVRTKIVAEECPAFVRRVSKVEAEVRSIADMSSCDVKELLHALATCRTALQTDFDNVASWFTLPQGRDEPDTSFEEATHIAIAIIRRLWPSSNINADLRFNTAQKLRGKYLVPIVDILQILLDNVVRHSGLSGDQLSCSVEIGAEGGRLTILCCNSVMNLDRLRAWLARYGQPDVWEEGILEGSSREQNSGLHKLVKIARSDLNAKSWKLLPKLTENDKFDVSFTCICDNIMI